MHKQKIIWTDDMLAMLKKLRASGYDYDHCAEKIGVCRLTIYPVARSLGLNKRMNRGRMPAVTVVAKENDNG